MPVFKRYRHLTAFCAVIVVLGVPFLLRTISSSAVLEVYPSVVLPSGAMLAQHSKEDFYIDETELIGFNSRTKEEVKIEARELLKPIPQHFIFVVVNKGFGLRPYEKQLRLKYMPFLPERTYTLARREFSDAECEEVKGWLRSKIDPHLQSVTDLIVRKKLHTFDRHTTQRKAQEVLNEELYTFY